VRCPEPAGPRSRLRVGAPIGGAWMGGPSSGSLDPKGPAAETIADLWWLMVGLSVAVFLVFAVALVVGLTRRPKEGDAADMQRRLDRWIVGGGVLLPLVVVLIVFGATVVAMRELPDESEQAMRIEITGFQWRYEVTYPEAGVALTDELRLPVGRPVALHLRSEDVIHSFWLPELGGKLDMLPDGTNVLVLEAAEPGEWGARCAEFCGLRHASMQMRVVAEPAEQFDSWLAAQS
jgi:cytochrome c oxidase subunit 2